MFLKFTRFEDLLAFRYAADPYRCDEEWCVRDAADGTIFIELECPEDVAPGGINTYRHSLDTNAMDRAVKDGRVRLFYGMRFHNVGAFEDFRRHEAAREGEAWRVVFRDDRLDRTVATDDERMVNKLMARPLKQSVWGDDRPDPYFENRRFRNEDAVIVELARPVRWQDAETGKVILLGGELERK